jgi:hypothetical protein
MALETTFRRHLYLHQVQVFSLLPGFIHTAAPRRASLVQTGNGEPRKAHWLGSKQPTTSQRDQNKGGQDDRPPKRPDARGYRDLASISLGEVDEAYRYFHNQLVAAPAEAWIAKNYFCQLPLRRKGEDRPPVVFGRVKTCYPSDGHVNNVEEMELYFPRMDGAPNVLHLHADDISQQRSAQSYCVGVKFYLSQEEIADFRASENIFIEKGFAPLYETGYLDLLDVSEQNHSALPWLHVIGSGWFASIPDSVQPEIREQLRNIVRWNTTLFNYHPKRYALQYLSLNDELDFNYGFTEHFLVTPQNSEQVLNKVEESFTEIFMQGMG